MISSSLGRVRAGVLTTAASALAMLAITGTAGAASFTVNDTNDAPLATATNTNCVSTDAAPNQCTLRAAVQAADNLGGASTITLAAGTYQLKVAPSGTAHDPATGDLDVTPTNGASTSPRITITGAGSATTRIDANQIDRAFSVEATSALSLSGQTIENGKPTSADPGNGGAIDADGVLSLTGDVTLSDNTTTRTVAGTGNGGAIDSAHGAPLTIAGATLTGNLAGGFGGAIATDASDGDNNGVDGAVRITGSTFTTNSNTDTDTGGGGGALYNNRYGPGSITNSTFTGNQSAGQGGAIAEHNFTYAHIDNDRLSGNSATDDGGALVLDGDSGYSLNHDEIDQNTSAANGGAIDSAYGTITADGSSFIGNSAKNGGFIYANNGDDLTLTNTTIAKNTATGQGGAFDVTYSQPADLINDTIVFNTAGAASNPGGGIAGTGYLQVSTHGIENTVIAENTGGDCSDTGSSSSVPAGFDAGHNLDGDGSCFTGTGAAGDLLNTNPQLAQPASNGGATPGASGATTPLLTDAETAASPGIDKGTDTNCALTDAKGVARPQGASCDIGALEWTVGNGQLSLAKVAPKSATAGSVFDYTVIAGDRGPGAASNTTIVDQLPANTTVYGIDPSQGSCASAGSPAKITCNLGTVASGGGAGVTIAVTINRAGLVTNTASVSDDQGAAAAASATTQVNPAVVGSAPVATTSAQTHVSATAARLNGVVVPGAQSTGYFFQYGTSTSYGKLTSIGRTGTARQTVSTAIAHLSPGARYHFRVVAINSSGVAYGRDRSFVTPAGTLVVNSSRVTVKRGRATVPFSCRSTVRCRGSFSVTARVGASHRTATCASGRLSVAPGRRGNAGATLSATCRSALAGGRGHLSAKVAVKPSTGQPRSSRSVTLAGS